MELLPSPSCPACSAAEEDVSEAINQSVGGRLWRPLRVVLLVVVYAVVLVALLLVAVVFVGTRAVG